jgi:hypothetical protein
MVYAIESTAAENDVVGFNRLRPTAQAARGWDSDKKVIILRLTQLVV